MDTKYIIIIVEVILIVILLYNINNINNNINNISYINKDSIMPPKKSSCRNIKHGKLDNGLKYIINNTKCGDKITTMLFVKVGSRDESPRLNGMSHVLEHMMFQGTPTYPDSQKLHEAIDKYGAVFNAYTSLDITCYYITIYPKYINHALDILSDIYFNSLVLDKNLKKEKPVVLNELTKNKSKPSRVIQQEMISTLMKDTSMKNPVIGTEANVKSFKRDDLMSFLNFYYNPHKVLLSIGGYTDKQSVLLNNIKKRFGIKKTYPSIKKITGKRDLYPRFYELKTHSKIKYIKKDIDTSYVTIGFPTYKLHSKNSYVLDIIATILAGYMSSRLYKRLRNDLGIIYNINNNIDSLEDCGYYYLMCGTHDVEKCVPVIFEELNNLKITDVSVEELKRAKDHINGSNKMSMNDSGTLATHYGIHYLYYGKIVTMEETIDNLNKVTASDIKRVANLTFQHSKMKLSYMGKKKHPLKNILS